MSKVSWIIFAAIVVILFGGLIIYSRMSNPLASIDVSNVDTNAILEATEQSGNIGDHFQGSKDSKVVLIEYGDFQCPSCGGAHPNIKTITEEYGDKIAFVFRNLPLTTIHPNARAAAAAVEAAGLSGKYWEMHDAIFESQSEWSSLNGDQRTNYFVAKATTLGMDGTKFREDLASTTVNQKISFDQALTKKLKLTGTPTFFLDGQKMSDDVTTDIVRGNGDLMRESLNNALKAQGIEPPAEKE